MKPVLAIWIDALRLDQITETHTPFLKHLASPRPFSPLVPPFGYTSIGAALFTGRYPEKSGQLYLYGYRPSPASRPSPLATLLPYPVRPYLYFLYHYARQHDFFYPLIRPQYDQGFAPGQTQYYHHPQALKVPTLLQHLARHHRSFLVYNWPLLVSQERSHLTWYVPHGDLAQLRRFFGVYQPDTNFALLHLWQHDDLSHRHGTNSKEVKTHLSTLDHHLAKHLTPLLASHNLVIFSDHGMLPVKHHRNLITALPLNLKHTTFFLDSTVARFWFQSEDERVEITQRLSQLSWGKWLTTADKARYRLDLDDDFYGQQLFLAEPGTVISPNFFQGHSQLKGMHGYDLSQPGEWGAYWSNAGLVAKTAATVDLFPTLLDLLQLPRLPSDGTSLIL